MAKVLTTIYEKKEVFSATENLSTVQQPPCGYYNWPLEL
jgi:hypothetical protein